MNKIIYIAGPYSGKTSEEQEQHIKNARNAAKVVWGQDGIAICPHLNTQNFDQPCWLHHHSPISSYEHFRHGYCEILTRCDAIWLIQGWENSDGARAEHYLATYLDLTILQTAVQVSHYIKEAKQCPMQKMYK